jgi:UDP-3-O-[3-hydroxymyristoyl] glucosamine N-acyltransferase
MKLKDICDFLNYDIIGDKECIVNKVTYAHLAQKNEIAIIRHCSEMKQTKSNVILTNKLIISFDKTVVLCSGPVLQAAEKICELLIKSGEISNYGKLEQYTMQEGYYLTAKNTFIGNNTSIGAFSVIGSDVYIGNNCLIGESVHISAGSIIGNNCIIKNGAKVGTPAFFRYDNDTNNNFIGYGKVIIDDYVSIGTNTIIQRGTFADTLIAEKTSIGDLVVIGHDVRIGKCCHLVTQSGIAGNSILEDEVVVYGQCGIAENVRIGHDAVIMAKSRISKNVKHHEVVSGLYGRKHSEELKLQAKLRFNM